MQSSSKNSNNDMVDNEALQAGGGMPSMNQRDAGLEAKRQAEQQEMMKNTILSQIMDKSALARLSNLMVVKPEKARSLEMRIIQLARTGQISSKMTDEDLRKLLDQITGNSSKTAKVKYDRRRAAIDSDVDEEEVKKNDDSTSEDD